MSGKRSKRLRRSYGRHEPIRVMTEAELVAGLADLENLPSGTRLVVVSDFVSARTARSAEDGDGVE